MNVIFLDIDGCLRTHKSDVEWSLALNMPIPIKVFDRKFSTKAVSNINYIHTLCHCSIVVTSTWRCNFSLEELRSIFKANRIHVPVIDKTCTGLNSRGEEIEQWLDTNEVNKYVIIDDQISDIIKIIGSNHVVHCDPQIGFESDDLVDKTLNLLL